MAIADSISRLKSRFSGESDEEDRIRTDEEALEQEIQDVLGREETVKEELSYAARKKMNYYPQAINHTKEVLEEIEDAEEKAEEIEDLLQDVEEKIDKDENEIESDIREIEEHVNSIRELESNLNGIFSSLEDEIGKKDYESNQIAERIMELLEKQRSILENAVEGSKAFQKNENGLYPVMGYIYDLAKAVKNEEEEIEKLRQEFKDLQEELEHLETAEQHSVQLIKKEKSLEKVQDSESVKHTKEAIEKGDGDVVSVYSSKEPARVVEEEAQEIRQIESRTGDVADRLKSLKQNFSSIEEEERSFSQHFSQIRSSLDEALETIDKELEEARKFEKMFLSVREELEEAQSKYEEHGLQGTENHQKVSKQVKLYQALHDEGRDEELERIFNGKNGVFTLLERVKDVIETGLEEAEKVSNS